MSQIWKDRVEQTVSGSPGTGAITLSTATSGNQALGAGDDGKTGYFYAVEGTAWETFFGTYTHSGTSLARTARYASSTGSAISFTSAATVALDVIAQAAQMMMYATQGVFPGGRLTATTAVPVTTSDVIGATSLFYTPHKSNIIVLWDGNMWTPVIFTEQTLALGTVTSGNGYDVFGFISSGVLAIEKLAWTSGSARATAVTLQDGRYCKSGDKTRLYLGSFYTTSTTTTEDSGGGTTTNVGGKRYVWNMYNRVPRFLAVKDTTPAWTYTSAAIRIANANGSNIVQYFCGMSEDSLSARIAAGAEVKNNTTAAAFVGVGVDSNSTTSGHANAGFAAVSQTAIGPLVCNYFGPMLLGWHYLAWLESGANANCDFEGDGGWGGTVSGLSAEIMA